MTSTTTAPSIVQSLEEEWIHVDVLSCTQCLEYSPEHIDELLECLFKATGTPKKDVIYKTVVKIINETFDDNDQQAKEIRRQVRKLINERLIETARYVCLKKTNKFALQLIAEELLLLPKLFSLNREIRLASFDRWERFSDFYGRVEISENGRRAQQPPEGRSSIMLRGDNLYTLDEDKSTFEVCLRIERFYSCISIGICSNNVSPNDIDQASNTFPINPSPAVRDGDIFHLLIDVKEYTIFLWRGDRSKRHQNSEQKKRERTISRRRCPLPWRFFVILTGKNNRVRIVY